MLDIELGSIKKFSYEKQGIKKVVIGVYADNVLNNNLRTTTDVYILGISQDGDIISESVPENKITYTATKLDPTIREKLSDIYDTYQKKQKIEERKKKCINEIDELRNKIYELQNNSYKVDEILQSKLTKIANKKGFMSHAQFISTVMKYLSNSFLNDKDKFEIYNSELIIRREVEVDRVPFTEVENSGLGYIRYDGTIEQNSYDKIKHLPLVKGWESKYSFKNYVSKNLVEDDFSYGDKGHVHFISNIVVPLKKSLISEYAKEVAYQILGKKLTTRKTKK